MWFAIVCLNVSFGEKNCCIGNPVFFFLNAFGTKKKKEKKNTFSQFHAGKTLMQQTKGKVVIFPTKQ